VLPALFFGSGRIAGNLPDPSSRPDSRTPPLPSRAADDFTAGDLLPLDGCGAATAAPLNINPTGTSTIATKAAHRLII